MLNICFRFLKFFIFFKICFFLKNNKAELLVPFMIYVYFIILFLCLNCILYGDPKTRILKDLNVVVSFLKRVYFNRYKLLLIAAVVYIFWPTIVYLTLELIYKLFEIFFLIC